MELTIAVYRLTKSFPREEVYGLTSQLRRSAVSIPSNIAEGQGRLSTGEFRQFWESHVDRIASCKLNWRSLGDLS